MNQHHQSPHFWQQFLNQARQLLGQQPQPPLPPGPSTFPYLDFSLGPKLLGDTFATLMGFYDTYGPAFTIRILNLKQIWLIGAEANHHILVKNHKNFSWGDGQMGEFIPFLGRGLLTTDGDVHDRARRMMQPLFRKDRMLRYAEEMIQRSRDTVAQLQPGQELELAEWTRDLALEIATHILFGMDTNPEDCRTLGQEFQRGLSFYGQTMLNKLRRGPGSAWSQLKKARKHFDRVLYTEIKKRRDRESNGENLLDLLLQARDGQDRLSDKEVRDQVMTLLFAGHDTTTATISWMIALLGQYPDAYQRLLDEFDTHFQQASTDSPLAVRDFHNGFPYLEQVLAETLRMYPPAWLGPRKSIEPFEVMGREFPGNTGVIYSSWLTHHLPEYFPDPHRFDPSRMTPERIKALPPGAYVPFGWGPRLCIGKHFGELEIKIIAASLHEHFQIELLPGQEFPAHVMPTISPKYGVQVRINER